MMEERMEDMLDYVEELIEKRGNSIDSKYLELVKQYKLYSYEPPYTSDSEQDTALQIFLKYAKDDRYPDFPFHPYHDYYIPEELVKAVENGFLTEKLEFLQKFQQRPVLYRLMWCIYTLDYLVETGIVDNGNTTFSYFLDNFSNLAIPNFSWGIRSTPGQSLLGSIMVDPWHFKTVACDEFLMFRYEEHIFCLPMMFPHDSRIPFWRGEFDYNIPFNNHKFPFGRYLEL